MKTYSHHTEMNPKIVVIGGGTGLSTMLRGLKKHTKNITAIVTVADDGGGSGVLRSELGMPPPGDIRNCIRSLANTEPTMEALLDYRFTDGSLKGQSFGNLFLAALNGMSDSFDQAVERMSDVLAITGRVLPVTNEDIQLVAEFDDGTEVLGESRISVYKKKKTDSMIKRVRLIPENPMALPASVRAIEEAEMIILGPGSLYTSIIPNLLTDGIAKALSKSDALRVYVLNIMTQDGETEGYTASDHINALFTHGNAKLFDFCLANDLILPEDVLARYKKEGSEPTKIDLDEITKLHVDVIMAPVSDSKNHLARHDPSALSKELLRIFRNNSPTRIYS